MIKSSNTIALLNLFDDSSSDDRWKQMFSHVLWSSKGRRWVLWDMYIGGLAAWSAFNLTPYGRQPHGLIVGVFFGLIMGLACWISGVPRPEANSSRYELLTVSLMGVVLGIILCMVAGMGLAYVRIGRWIWVLFGCLSYIGIIVPRLLVSSVEFAAKHRVLIYGGGQAGKAVLEEFRNRPGIEIVGIIDDNRTLWTQSIHGIPCLGGIDQALTISQQLSIQLIAVAVTTGLPEVNAQKLLSLRQLGVEIMDVPELYERFLARIPIDFISSRWLLSGEKITLQTMVMMVKRLVDVVTSLIGLMVTVPLWIPIALAIKLDSSGPVFFRQWRMGYNHQPFRIIKFRSMVADAEQDGAQWARSRDARITRVGHFLRVSRLDEIPQFVNVLKGDMSMVGPRPERPEFIAEIEKSIPYYDQRYLVNPGVTGWAQVRYQYGASLEDAKQKLEYDLYYVRNISFRLDLQILLRTVVMLMKGSR